MSRKRNNLDTLEADFIYSQLLLRLSKQKDFDQKFVLEKNKLLDELSAKAVDMVHQNEDDREAVKFELRAYKMSDEEREKSLQSDDYINNLEKPANFTDDLKNKYFPVFDEILQEFER